LLQIDPYVGGSSRLPGFDRPIKLSANEGAFGPSPKAAEAVRRLASELHRYPDGDSTDLRDAIAAAHGLPAERILCGTGSDEVIGMLVRAYAGASDEVLFTRHAFAMYPIATLAAGATPVTVAEDNLTADVDGLIAGQTERTRVVCLANPNNPTGTFITTNELRRLRRGLRDDILLIIDSAYAEYIQRPDYDDGASLVTAGDNTVMTRTFSKIYGLGAVRLGWAYAPEEVTRVFHRVRTPFNVSAPAQVAGVAALGDPAFRYHARQHNDRMLPWFAERVRQMGLGAPASVANFQLVRFADADAASGASGALAGAGIIARPMAIYGLGECLRITLGMDEEMTKVVDTLAAFTRS